jgi:hypothetical protein
MSLKLKRRVIAKTADYTIAYPMDAPGTVFTNDGAVGAVAFTLPAANIELLGVEYFFRGIADQTITVKPPVADTAVGFNDAAIDSLAASTGGQKIGAEIKAQCVKSGGSPAWMISGTAVGHTYTVAT